MSHRTGRTARNVLHGILSSIARTDVQSGVSPSPILNTVEISNSTRAEGLSGQKRRFGEGSGVDTLVPPGNYAGVGTLSLQGGEVGVLKKTVPWEEDTIILRIISILFLRSRIGKLT